MADLFGAVGQFRFPLFFVYIFHGWASLSFCRTGEGDWAGAEWAGVQNSGMQRVGTLLRGDIFEGVGSVKKTFSCVMGRRWQGRGVWHPHWSIFFLLPEDVSTFLRGSVL